eukprot:8843-Pelagomonas_calceolata.AAC.3
MASDTSSRGTVSRLYVFTPTADLVMPRLMACRSRITRPPSLIVRLAIISGCVPAQGGHYCVGLSEARSQQRVDVPEPKVCQCEVDI